MTWLSLAAAALTVVVGVAAMVAGVVGRRLPRADVVWILGGGLGITGWSLYAAAYARGVMPDGVSSLFLASVALACTSFFVGGRRMLVPSRSLRGPLAVVLAVEPVLLVLSAVLPHTLWGPLFWQGAWHRETYGIGYWVHTLYCLAVIAGGCGPLFRRAEQTSGLNRVLSACAPLSVLAGVAAQMVGQHWMHVTAVIAYACVCLLIVRVNAAGLVHRLDRSLRDPLTGTLTRAALDQVLDEAVSRAGRTGRPLSLLLVDVDDFKRVNDEHGHLVGDQVLVEIARHITAVVDGPVARFGGDEFVAVLEDTGVEVAEAAAIQLTTSLSVVGLPELGLVMTDVADTREVPVACSVGVAQYAGGASADLLAAADAAMYRAKRAGRLRGARLESVGDLDGLGELAYDA